jgi:hypothetical protein
VLALRSTDRTVGSRAFGTAEKPISAKGDD